MKIKLTVTSLILIPFFVFVWFDQTDVLKWWIAIVALCIVYINFDKFQSFTLSAGRIEAKLNEADRVIEEAQTTLKDLKNSTEPLISYSLAHLVRGDLIIGVNAIDKEALYTKSKKLITDLSITDERTLELLSLSKDKVSQQYITEIEFSSEISAELTSYEQNEVLHNFFESLRETNDFSPNKIRSFYDSNQQYYNEDVEEFLKNYEEFLKKEKLLN